MDNKKIGDYISNLRKKRNLTQKDLADILGITDKAVSKWERGAGYPDISLLRPLADVLGTTVNELLEGEHSKNLCDTSNEVNNALNYVNQILTFKEHKYGKILATLLSISFILAVCISIIVDIAVNHTLSWSLLVTTSCILSGCIVLPPLLKNKRGLIYSLCFLTVLLIPYLASIELIISGSVTSSGWLWGIGIPVSLTWLIIIWLILFLIKRSKVNAWYKVCIGLILCIPGQLLTNYVIDVFTNNVININSRNVSNITSVFCILAASCISFIIGLNMKKKVIK